MALYHPSSVVSQHTISSLQLQTHVHILHLVAPLFFYTTDDEYILTAQAEGRPADFPVRPHQNREGERDAQSHY
jgi:hypothetical protein